MSDRAKLPCRGEECKACPQTECLSRIMSDNEQKPMYITDDLLEQSLRNDMQICRALISLGARGMGLDKSIADTEALLERIKD